MSFTREEAQEIWAPQHNRLISVVDAAWEEFKAMRECRLKNGFPPQLYNRTKSNDIFDAIERNAFEEFGTDDAFFLKIQSQTFKIFHKNCCIRFKKSGGNLLGQNIPTQSVMNFIEADGQLSGMPYNTAKLEIVWVANELFTDLESIHMVARDGDRLIWEYPLERESGTEIVNFDLAPQTESNENDDQLVKLRQLQVPLSERE